MQSRFYPTLNVTTAVERMRQFFGSEGHDIQVLAGGDITIIQARKETTLTNLTGLSSALTIRFAPDGSGVRVEAGVTKWMDKAAVGVVGLAVPMLWPLMATAAYGAYNQHKLIQDIWRILDDLAGIGGAGGGWTSPANYKPGSWAEDVTCASCGSNLPAGVSFCARCGADLTKPRTCAACGVQNRPGARFCTGCGEKV